MRHFRLTFQIGISNLPACDLKPEVPSLFLFVRISVSMFDLATVSAKAFFVDISVRGELVPHGGGTGSPRFWGDRFPEQPQPISFLDCKNPKGKPGWGKTLPAAVELYPGGRATNQEVPRCL